MPRSGQDRQVILEGILTTVNEDGSVNIAPQGPIVDSQMRELVLRPYQTSTTYANLKRTGEAVFHVTDDVELLAHAAVGRVDPPPPMRPAKAVSGFVLVDACRWYALRVRTLDDRQPRTEIVADVVDQGTQREFFGLNRAKHAVVEAAIAATRLEFLPMDEVLRDLARLAPLVRKTGGPAEQRAFEFLDDFIRSSVRNLGEVDMTS